MASVCRRAVSVVMSPKRIAPLRQTWGTSPWPIHGGSCVFGWKLENTQWLRSEPIAEVWAGCEDASFAGCFLQGTYAGNAGRKHAR